MADPTPSEAAVTSLTDLPVDMLEAVGSFLDAQSFGRFLCSCKTVRDALADSEPLWRRVAAWYGVACLAKQGPLDTDELGAAARAALDPVMPTPLTPGDAIPGGWGMPAACLDPSPDGPGAWDLSAARGVFEAQHAVEIMRLAGRDVDVSWACASAPAACATYKAAVRRYATVLGAFGAEGARAARAWARVERFLRAHVPVAYKSLLAGWRADPPPEETHPAVRVHPSVAAVLALHAGQLTLPRGPLAFLWLARPGRLTRDDVIAAAAGGVTGLVACYGSLHTGQLHPPIMAYRTAPPNRHGEFEVEPSLHGTFVALEDRGGGAIARRLFRRRTLHPLVVTTPDRQVGANPGPEVVCRSIFLDLAGNALYALAAGGVRMVNQRTGRLADPAPALIRADGGGGLVAWLERLAHYMESGLLSPSPALLQLDPAAWEQVRAQGAVPPREMALCGFPGLPLDRGLSPPELAALAASWPDAAVGVALTSQFQIVAGVVYSTDCDPVEGFAHVFSYRITMCLLDPADVPTEAVAADAAGTWPALTPRPGDDAHFPPRARPPALRAARLRERVWVIRRPDGSFKDAVRGEGVVGETPRLVAGAAGPHFTYASRSVEPTRKSPVDSVDASLLPGSVIGSMDGAFVFDGETLDGKRVEVWARTPRMVLRVPKFRF